MPRISKTRCSSHAQCHASLHNDILMVPNLHIQPETSSSSFVNHNDSVPTFSKPLNIAKSFGSSKEPPCIMLQMTIIVCVHNLGEPNQDIYGVLQHSTDFMDMFGKNKGKT
jgi:hypothetical protein